MAPSSCRNIRSPPELTRYRHEGTATIDGVECDVYAGPARSERLWIEKASGLVKATSRSYWGESLPNYVAELVAEAAGRTYRDDREYGDWLEKQPAKVRELLTAHSAAAHWPLTEPGNLTVYSDYRELQPQVEFPMRAERIVVHPIHAGEGFQYYRSETEITDVTEKFDISKLAASALPRVGDAMTDRRSEPAIDYTWTDNQAEDQRKVAGMRDERIAQLRIAEEKNQLINSRPINSVADAIKVLTEGPDVEPTKVWARAIKYLADHREEAFPADVAALDAEQRDHPISKLAFALRAMGDRRAVPALIRALPKTLLPSRSDYGLLLDGQGSDHDELLRFVGAHDINDKSDDGEYFSYGRAFREVALTLQKLTGQDFSEMELNWVRQAESPAQLALQQEQFDRVARRWAEWWEANWRTMTDDKAYATVNLPPPRAEVPRAESQELPSEPGVRLEDVRSEWIVQSVHESSKRCFVDLDTMREGSWPDSLPPIDEIGADSSELLAWARQEGFDLMGITFTPPGESEPLYCLKPLDAEAWKITPPELRELKRPAAGMRRYPLSRPVELMVPQRKIMPPFDHAVDGDSFLYLTREGTAGVIRMTAQVPKNNAEVGRPYSPDDDFMPTGFYPGAKAVFAVLQKSDEATDAEAPSEPGTSPEAPASIQPNAPKGETKSKDRGGATLKASVKSAQGAPLTNVYLTLWRDPNQGAAMPRYAASGPSGNTTDFGFYRNVIWNDGASPGGWERIRSAQPNDGRHGRDETEFHFDKLPAGSYRLTAVSYDSKAAAPDPTPYAVSDVITLDGEGEQTAEMTMLSGDVQLQLRVVDAETRQPISGVALRLRDAADMPIVHGHGSGNFFERTDDAGGVRFGTLPAGKYSVEVLGKYAAVNNFVEYPPLADRVEVAIHPGEQTVEIALPPRRLDEAEIERRFPFSAFGVVTDDQGNPLAGVEVKAATGIGTLWGGGSVKTDDEGRYRLYFGAGLLREASDSAPMGVGIQSAQFYAMSDGWEMPEERDEHPLYMSDRPREALAADIENGIDDWEINDLDRIVYPHQPREINFRLQKKRAAAKAP